VEDSAAVEAVEDAAAAVEAVEDEAAAAGEAEAVTKTSGFL
jgi:hypothetical protein